MDMNKKKKNVQNIVDAEYGVDSRYTSEKERLSDGKALMEARLLQMNKVSEEQVLWARLSQLKLQMETFISDPGNEEHYSFTGFLKSYIDTLYSKRNIFARDMDISPVSLSQVLNCHREPKLEFLLRLMIHSEQVYRNVCPFRKDTWFKVYYHEKINATLAVQNKWQPEEEKHVNISEPMESYGKLLKGD